MLYKLITKTQISNYKFKLNMLLLKRALINLKIQPATNI